MAEEPAVPIEQQPAAGTGGQTPTDLGYSNKDLKEDSLRDIASNTEEPPVPTEAPVETEPEPVGEEEVPLEDVIKQSTTQAVEELEIRRKADEEAAKQPPPTPKEQRYLEWADKFNKDNNRVPTYLEAMQFVENNVVDEVEARQVKKEEDARIEQEKIDTQRANENKQLNEVIDDEMEDLYTAGKLTRIKDVNNPNDQGVIERKELFSKWAEVNAQRTAEGKPQIISATRIFDFHYQKPNAQPAGANAPIAGPTNSSTTQSEDQKYSYNDIKKPWSFFRRG